MSEYESIIYLEKNTETWGSGPPKMGDHIRVKRAWGLYAHHGIYVSDDEVIHFAGQEKDSIFDWSNANILLIRARWENIAAFKSVILLQEKRRIKKWDL